MKIYVVLWCIPTKDTVLYRLESVHLNREDACKRAGKLQGEGVYEDYAVKECDMTITQDKDTKEITIKLSKNEAWDMVDDIESNTSWIGLGITDDIVEALRNLLVPQK